MSWSENELAGLMTKAARGAGAPAAQAARFGAAAACHLRQGRGEAELAAAIAQLPGGPILRCPLALVEVLTQAAGKTEVAAGVDAGDQPDLVTSYVESMVQEVRDLRRDGDRLVFMLRPAESGRPCAPQRLQISAVFAAQLQTLAERTFVPESDASRLAGAGAGLTDND